MAPDPLLPLWSTPLGVHRFAQAADVNPLRGAAKGVTRFYGAHMDFGNAYLQPAHIDIAPLLEACAAEGIEAKRMGKEPNSSLLLWTVAVATAGKTGSKWDFSPPVAADVLLPRRLLGQLIVFPSWLAHQALPYDGADDRVIVSFNASVHTATGSDPLHGYSHV